MNKKRYRIEMNFDALKGCEISFHGPFLLLLVLIS